MTHLSDGKGFLVGCLGKQPLMLFQSKTLIVPEIEQNAMLPMKPIQRLSSLAEQNGIITMAHGNRCLEFAKLKWSEDGPSVQRIYQTSSIAYDVIQSVFFDFNFF